MRGSRLLSNSIPFFSMHHFGGLRFSPLLFRNCFAN
jgi:hypothetical protein